MLDKQRTADRLRERLEGAFKRWNELESKTNTKAHLAREVARLAGRPCSPQVVSGWFSTGRMDKAWIPHVEQVLGESMGFGGVVLAPPPAASSPAPQQASMGGLDWLPEKERELLLAYRDIKLPEMQEALTRPIFEKAAEARRYQEFFQQQVGHSGVVPDEELEHLRAPAHTPPAPKTARHRGTKIDESALSNNKPTQRRHKA